MPLRNLLALSMLAALVLAPVPLRMAGAQETPLGPAARYQGEELYYSLEFFGAEMARGALVMGQLQEVEGQPVLPVSGLAVTEGVAAMVYPLRDEGNTLISALTGLAQSSTKELNERGENRRYDVVYHQDRYVADNTRLRYGITSYYERILPSSTHDAFSWIYAVRDQDLALDTSVVYFLWDGWRLSRVTATVVDDDEDILVGDEFVACRRINLYREVLDSARPIPWIQETATLPPALWVQQTTSGEQVGNLWLSTDDRRLPVQMEFANQLVTATARLINYRPPTQGY